MAKTSIVSTLIALLFCAPGLAAESTAEATAKELATEAAETWLTLVDDRMYSESWESAASLVQNAITEDQWNRSLRTHRGSFGTLIKRTLKSREFNTSLPGAPDGQYVVIQFETSFEKKAAAVETVTPMLDSDGKWRVSGYYIK